MFVAIAAHGALLALAYRSYLSVALVVGIVSLVVLKHRWRRFRH
jgi:hypothetical protein